MAPGPKLGQIFFYDANFPPEQATERPVADSFLNFLANTYCVDTPAMEVYRSRNRPEKPEEKGESEEEEENPENEGQQSGNNEGAGPSEGRGAQFFLPFYGFVSPHGYVRVKDYVIADAVLSMMFGTPVGPIYRHNKKAMWEHGVYIRVTKKQTAKVNYVLVPKAIGSVVWGGMPRVNGCENFVQLAKTRKVIDNMRNFIAK